MNICILGATSEIAKDLIILFSNEKNKNLYLFARRPKEVIKWLSNVGLSNIKLVDSFDSFGSQNFDVILNFVGVGDPSKAAAMGSSIFDVTIYYDDLVLRYLNKHPKCRYIFLSSGAAYGANFSEPASLNSNAVFAINNLGSHEWYGISKMFVECRHRAYPELNIIDIRVFNYFSRTQNLEARFFIADILRAIRDNKILKTSSDTIMRDYLHPLDFYQLICAILSATPTNTAVDCYSKAPIDKVTLLMSLQKQFGLRYKFTQTNVSISATGNKPNYYSLNRRAADFGYCPILTSYQGIMKEASAILQK